MKHTKGFIKCFYLIGQKIALLLFIPRLFKNIFAFFKQTRAIKRWRKQLSIPKNQSVLNELYSNNEGFYLSKQARSTISPAIEHTYGEIQFESFIALLSLCNPNSNDIFYDLGSGIGHAVIAASLTFPLQKSCGIELFENLNTCALAKKETLTLRPEYRHLDSKLYFHQADFLTFDFSDATIIYLNATAYFGEYWENISQYLAQTLNCDTIVITTSKAIVSNAFITLEKTIVEMTFGVVTAFIQKKG